MLNHGFSALVPFPGHLWPPALIWPIGAITWIKAYNFYTARDLDRGWASSLTAKAAMALRRLAPGFGWKGGTQIGAYIIFIYIYVCSYIYIYTHILIIYVYIYLYVKQPNIDLYDSWCAIYLQIVHVHHSALWWICVCVCARFVHVFW